MWCPEGKYVETSGNEELADGIGPKRRTYSRLRKNTHRGLKRLADTWSRAKEHARRGHMKSVFRRLVLAVGNFTMA